MKKSKEKLRVQVYRNLHKNCYSVRSKKSGRVIAHADEVILFNVKFVVREGGRQKVLREKRKNVHAFVEGDLQCFNDLISLNFHQNVRYNPYEAGYFKRVIDGEPVYVTEMVCLNKRGVWV